MTRSTGRRNASAGPMSTRTTSSRRAALLLLLASSLAPSLARAGGEYEEARLSAGDRARNLAVSHERRRPLPVRLFAPLRGAPRRGAGAVQAHLERAPAVALPPRRLDGRRRVALLRRQRLQGRARRL